MKNKDKVDLLYDRHIKILIEWGGIPGMCENVSTMSREGATELLDLLRSNDKDKINKVLTDIVTKENHGR